jgi:hypothetical protein
VQPTARKRKGLAAKQTRFAREEWMLGAAGTEPAARRAVIEPAFLKSLFAGEIFAVLAGIASQATGPAMRSLQIACSEMP